MSRFIIPFLSFVLPGLSYYFLDKKKKAFSMMTVFFIVLLLFFFSKQSTMKLIAILTYVLLAFPSFVETALRVYGGREKDWSDSKIYTSILLLTTGMAALPLLWQSHAFQRQGKIIWTILVFVLAALFFFFLNQYISTIEEKLKVFL